LIHFIANTTTNSTFFEEGLFQGCYHVIIDYFVNISPLRVWNIN